MSKGYSQSRYFASTLEKRLIVVNSAVICHCIINLQNGGYDTMIKVSTDVQAAESPS